MPDLMAPKAAAAALKISQKTLRGHVKDGSITFVVTGRGKKRPRIAFAQYDLERFEEERRRRNMPAEGIAWQSTSRRKAPSTTMTSRSNVYAFTAQRKKPASEKRAK